MQPELGFKKWLRSVIQQGVMMLKKIDDKVDWDERDHELAQMLHRDWYNGEYIILGFDYAAKAREDAQQKGLFDTLPEEKSTIDAHDDLAK